MTKAYAQNLIENSTHSRFEGTNGFPSITKAELLELLDSYDDFKRLGGADGLLVCRRSNGVGGFDVFDAYDLNAGLRCPQKL